MFLHQILLNDQEAFRHRVFDGYQCHRFLWKVFSQRVLFRMDSEGSGLKILALSENPYDGSSKVKVESKKIPERFYDADEYVFSLRANNTKKIARFSPDGKRLRQGSRAPQDIDEWLGKKATQCGVKIVSSRCLRQVTQHSTKNGKRVPHVLSDVSGVLRVVDRAAFKAAFAQGIGPAKGFGFGLLLLKRL